MTEKELISMLANEHNEQKTKLLRDFPTLFRDLCAMVDYEEKLRLYSAQKVRAKKQWAREWVLEHYGIGINTFYEIQKRVELVLARL